MKNISTRDLERKAEIAEEFNAVLQTALRFRKSGVKLVKPIKHYTNMLNNYVNSFDKKYMTKTNLKKLNDIRTVLGPLSESSAASIVQSINALLLSLEYTHIDLLNYNKTGLKEGVSQKSDICIDIYKDEDIILTKHFSLKQYKKFSDVQVASGTYLSTICGLAFDVVGRGKFVMPNGDTFVSKNYDDIMQAFSKTYGIETQAPLLELMKITKRVHNNFRTMPTKPPKALWKRACTQTGKAAGVPFAQILKMVQSRNPSIFKERFLSRSGLKNSSDKEIVYSAWDKGKAITFNTMSDDAFNNLVLSINKPSTGLKLSIYGQSIRIAFMDGDNESLIADTPLTINSNGAWANKDRYCAISKMHIKKDHLRPVKALQLDTSTNCWLKLKAACFNTILKERREQ